MVCNGIIDASSATELLTPLMSVSMSLWPAHTHTAPNSTPDSVIVARVLALVAVMVCSSNEAVVGGSTATQVWFPRHHRVVVSMVLPANVTATVSDGVLKPHTAACCGADCSTIPSPCSLENRRAGRAVTALPLSFGWVVAAQPRLAISDDSRHSTSTSVVATRTTEGGPIAAGGKVRTQFNFDVAKQCDGLGKAAHARGSSGSGSVGSGRAG